MQNNTNHNNESWKSRLDALDALPNETFDTNVSFDKLHARKKQRKVGYSKWMSIAAAMVPVMIATIFLFDKKDETGRVGYIPFHNNMELFWPAPVAVLPISPIVPETIVPAETQIKNIVTNKLQIAETTAVATLQKATIQLPEDIVKPVQDTFAQVLATAPSVKKIKTIRYNELNNGNAVTEDVNDGRPYFPVKFKNREAMSSNNATRDNGADNLIKIKLSPQN